MKKLIVNKSRRQRFWYGFGFEGCPSFQGRSVLEIGCGHGSRCIEIAQNGAGLVLGFDTSKKSIEVANERLLKEIPKSSYMVKFQHGSINKVKKMDFDVIISENTFEHILGVDEVLQQMRIRMNLGALAYIGFDPLYHSPFGDHGWMRSMLPCNRWFSWPWGHLLFPSFIFRRLSLQFGQTITQTQDWPYQDLNQLTINDFRRQFQNSGLSIVRLRTNVFYSWKGNIFAVIGKFPYLDKYFTSSVFCTLRRDH